MHSACVFKAHAEYFFALIKPPVGGLESLLGAACSTSSGGVVCLHGYTLTNT